jgi:hypothetical protein
MFSTKNLQLYRGNSSSSTQGKDTTDIITYTDLTATVANIIDSFPPYLGQGANQDAMVVGDHLVIVGSDTTFFTRILSLNPFTVSTDYFSGASGLSIGAPVAASDGNALKITGQILQAQIADVTHPGILSNGTQIISGLKTFNSLLTANANIKTDNINENTLDAGVTIEGTLLKDDLVDAQNVKIETFDGGKALISADTVIVNKYVHESVTTAIELSYVSGATSNIQTQIDSITTNNTGINRGDLVTDNVINVPNATGMSMTAGSLLDPQKLQLTPADGTNPGVLTAGAQTIGGSKTFTGAISAANLSGFNHGDLETDVVNNLPNSTGMFMTAGGAGSAQKLQLTPADATSPGVVTEVAQTFGGNKTFTGAISASNLSNTNTGNVSLLSFGVASNAAGLTLTAQQLNLEPADASNPGGVSTTTQSLAGLKTFDNGVRFATTGGSPTTLDYYEESGTILLSATGALSTTFVILIKRIGRMCILTMAAFADAVTSTNNKIVSSSGVDTQFRPASTVTWTIPTIDGATTSTRATGELSIDSSGIVTLASTNGGNFILVNAGMSGTSQSYFANV